MTKSLRLLAFLALMVSASSRRAWAAYPPLQITEFMAANKNTLLDEDGASSPWIEILNPTTNQVGLSGWRLTILSNNSAQWTFPDYVMTPGEYLVVFASAKNRTTVTSELHTNFKLSPSGGFLALVDPSGRPASTFSAYPPQDTDVSYGADPVQSQYTGFFTKPTPGDLNNSLGPGFAPEVAFSRPAATFTAPFQLGLTVTDPEAAIRYTLDGSLPVDTSTVYSNAIRIAATTQVRARAFTPGLMPGQIHSQTYVQLTTPMGSVTSSLPIIVIHDYGAGSIPVPAGTPPNLVNLGVYEPVNGVTRLTNPPTLDTSAGINVRGSSTRGLPKQSWDVQFWGDLTNAINLSPLGLPADSDWALYAPDNFEPVLIHNPLIYQLSNEIGRYAPRTRLVEVYLNTEGGAVSPSDYFGIYVLEEKIKRGPNRVDVDKLDPDDNLQPDVTGGYMLKIDRLGIGESGMNAAGQLIVYNGPTEAEIKTPERLPQDVFIQDYVDDFGSSLGADYRDPVRGYAAYIDPNSWIDHHILNIMAFNVDALRLSAYFYKPRGGKIFFGPIWDFDRSQGSTDGRDFNPRVWRAPIPDYGTDFFNYTWWGTLFTDIDFWQKWIDRYQDLRAGLLSTNHIFADIDGLVDQLRSEESKEIARWPGITTPRSGTVTISGYSYNFSGAYQGEVNFIKHWYADRLNFMDTNFLAKPVFSPDGGGITPGAALTMTAPAGAKVYYTLDGSDPRLSGGGISTAAQTYTAPVLLAASAVITARAFNAVHKNVTGANAPPLTSPWSGLTTATFGVLTSPALVAYTNDGAVYTQNFDSLPNSGATTVNAANPVVVNEVNYALGNPFGLALPAAGPGGLGGLGLSNSMPGWFALGDVASKFGASAGDQSTGGIISFGPTNSAATNRALGLLATSSSGPTAFGLRLVNATGHTLGQISLQFTAELWRQSAVAKTVSFGYFIDPSATNSFSTNLTAALTNLDANFPPFAAGSKETAVDGTNPANQQTIAVAAQPIADWPPAAALWLVWRMADSAGKGQGIAIDNLAFFAAATPPTLGVQLSGGNLLLSWPTNATGFFLQKTSALGQTNPWTALNPTITSTNGTNSTLLPAANSSSFFRLAK
jgi:hypothetical protein